MNAEKTMNQYQKGLIVWPLLVLAARNQQILSYGMVEEMTGIHRHGELRIVLGNIYFYCKKNNWPWINLLVVNQEEGNPGADVFANVDVPKEHRRIFVHDWRGKAPLENDLEEAREWSEKAQAA